MRDTFERINYEWEKTQSLYGPLMNLMLPERYRLDKAGAPLEGRNFELSKSVYKEQFEAGIHRVAGIDIRWVE